MPRKTKTKKRSYRKKGGENTSPNKAAKRIQSRYRGNKGRKVAKQEKEQEEINKFKELILKTEDLPDDVVRNILSTMRGRGKKKKSKNKKGGENTSPNTRAAKRIQSRFRGNKDRKYAATEKQLKNLRNNEVFNLINMHYKNMTGKDLSGRGKKKKSKKLTNKKRSKKRSIKRGG